MRHEVPTPDTTGRSPIEVMEGRHEKVLEELAELGLEHARLGLGQAMNETMGKSVPNPGTDYQADYVRLARSIRQTVALEAKLREPAKVRAEQKPPRPPLTVRQRAIFGKSKVRVAVEGMIDAQAGERREDLRTTERLLRDLYERLDDEPDATFTETALDEVVERLCKVMGVKLDWEALSAKPWARREALQGTPGSFYARAEANNREIEDDDPP